MSVVIPATITGAAQTGLTSPTYSTTADTALSSNAKQSAVTALGGTQAGVNVHSGSCPFTVTVTKPMNYQPLGKPNPATGLINNVPRNKYTVLTRKGVLPLAGQPFQTMILRSEFEVPSGADVADAANVRAAFSAHIGALWQVSSGLGDTAISNVL